MKEKWKVLAITIGFVGLMGLSMPKKPQLISNITTLDTSYLTILVDSREIGNREKLEEKLIQMCREDAFESMKLWSADRERTTRWNISVYSSKKELEYGKEVMRIKYQEGE